MCINIFVNTTYKFFLLLYSETFYFEVAQTKKFKNKIITNIF